MDDFEDMQKLLQTIPIEPCDSNRMRARFRLMLKPKEVPTIRGTTMGSFHPNQLMNVAVVLFAVVLIGTVALLLARQSVKWISAERVVPPLTTPVAEPSTAPVTGQAAQPEAVLEGKDFPYVASNSGSAASSVPIKMVEITGRVLTEDGSEISESLPIGGIAITESGNSSGIAATTMRLDGNGRFGRNIPAGEYRFRITEFSQNYFVRSMTSGGTDLLNNEIEVSGSAPVSMEILVSRKNDLTAGRVIGRVLDSETNSPPQADRVVLCCFTSGPVERITTPLRSDGTFEFDGVPAGSYTAELRGSREPEIVNPNVSVVGSGVSELNLISASRVVPVDITLRLDTGERLPYKPDTSIAFIDKTREFRVAASSVVGNLFRASVPANSSYEVTISNVGKGYAVQSIVDARMTDLLHGGVFMPTAGPADPARIVVTLTKN
jgi:hypothetical protein